MSLINGAQKIVFTDNGCKVVSEGGLFICAGKNVNECINKLAEKLKQEYNLIMEV